MVSVWHVGGTRGSGIVSSAADMFLMSMVRGMRGVGEVCEMCMCLGFTNHVRTGGIWTCVYVWVAVVWVVYVI